MSEDFFIDVDDGPKKKRKLNGVLHHKEKAKKNKGRRLIIHKGPAQDDDKETADEKRLRLAQEYLEKLGAVEAEDKPDADLIAERLDQDELKLRGKRFQEVASQLVGKEFEPAKVIKGHQGVTTCIAVSPDAQYAISASKDGTIVKWELETLKKLYTIHSRPKKQKRNNKQPDAASLLTSNSSSTPQLPSLPDSKQNKEQHAGGILSVAICYTGKYFATGGEDRSIILRDFETGQFVHRFAGHRGPVTGLCFVEGLNYIYSCSFDRTVKGEIWSTETMSYIDTLFGHQSEALAICILSSTKEKCITAGRDQSVRVWKVAEEKQLLFKSGPGNIDSVVTITDDLFVTGSDSGQLCVYNTNKKKAVTTVTTHKTGVMPWVSAVSSIPYTDLVASGGTDGLVRLWKVDRLGSSLKEVASVPVHGSVNAISFSVRRDGGEGIMMSGKNGQNDGLGMVKMVVAVGQEHRLGRWAKVAKVRNGIAVVPLPINLADL